MLVKFLSFIASVLGTDRYKPVVFSCLALLLASTGIFTILAFHQTAATPATSQTAPAKAESDTEPERQSSQLGVPRQQLQEDSTIQPDTPAEAPDTGPSSAPPATAKPPEPGSAVAQQDTTDLVLQLATVAMSAGTTTSPFSASSSDNSKLEWSVAPQSNETRLQLITDPLKEAASGIRLCLRADSDTPAGTYSFLITAKDTARSISLSKAFTVTVNP